MRTTIVLVFLGLIAGSFAYTATKVHPFKLDVEAVEKEVPAANAFSFKDILTLFQSESLESGATDRLYEYLQAEKEKLIREHQQHLELIIDEREQCKEEKSFRNNEITDAQAALQASTEHKELCTDEKSRAENLKDLAIQALAIHQAQLDATNANRASQVAIYQSRSASLKDVLAKIELAFDALNEFESVAHGSLPANFLQIVNTLLALSVKTGHSHHVLPIYNKLLQTHSKQYYDVNDVADLRALFQQVKENAQTALHELDEQEARDKQIYDETVEEITSIINKLNSQVAESDNYITRMSDCITQETSIGTLASGKIERNTELLNQAEILCEDQEAEYQQADAARTHQLELLGQLESAIQTLEAEYHENLFPEIGTIIDVEN